MKPKPPFEPHLILRTLELAPGGELSLKAAGWYLLQVTSGVGYWLHPRANHEVTAGSVLVFSDRAKGIIRCSQIAKLLVHVFRVLPERLTGLVTFSEQHFLQSAAAQDRYSVRLFDPTALISHKFKILCEHAKSSSLQVRLKMLELFVEAFGNDLQKHRAGPEAAPAATNRLIKLLNEISPADFLDLSFGDLVREMRCTPRHLSRIFQRVVGMPFRQKQAQMRLLRAQELLATTESKVVEVALESGYQSPCLFNLMFKRRFGVTPAKWRVQSRNSKPIERPDARSLVVKVKPAA
jgi:AraC-like DNA-binding protein